MRTFLLIIAIVNIVICVISLLFSALNRHGYYHLLDGDGDTYIRLRRRMKEFFVIGIITAAVGITCIIISFRI